HRPPQISSLFPYTTLFRSGVVRVPNVVEVNPSVPVKTIPELIAYAKTHPLSFASAGIGTASHLAGHLFNRITGVNMQHVPYRGRSEEHTSELQSRGHLVCR